MALTSLAILASWYLIYVITKRNAKKQYIGKASHISDLKDGRYEVMACIDNKHLEIHYEGGYALFGYFLLVDFNEKFRLCRIDTCDLNEVGHISIETVATLDSITVMEGKIAVASIKA